MVTNVKLRKLLFRGPKFRESRQFSWKVNVEKLIIPEVGLNTSSEWMKSIRFFVN